MQATVVTTPVGALSLVYGVCTDVARWALRQRADALPGQILGLLPQQQTSRLMHAAWPVGLTSPGRQDQPLSDDEPRAFHRTAVVLMEAVLLRRQRIRSALRSGRRATEETSHV